MSDKSHVTMEQHLCMVCGLPYDTGSILLDTRLRARFDRFTLTGWGMCPEHQALYDKGFVALIGCDAAKSGNPGATLKPEDAYRTGRVLHLKASAWPNIFNVEVPRNDGGDIFPAVFVEDEVIDMLSPHATQQEG